MHVLPRLCGERIRVHLPQLRRQSRSTTDSTCGIARQVSGIDGACPSRRRAVTTLSYSIYILRCADGSLYTGIALDVRRRLEEHRSGTRGAKYLRGRLPVELVFELAAGNRSDALRLEHRVKRMSKGDKEALIVGALVLQASGDSSG